MGHRKIISDSTLTTAEIRQFGIPLKQAVSHFASEDLLDELEAENKDPEPPNFDAQKPVLSAISIFAHYGQVSNLQRTRPQRVERINVQLRAHLCFMLETGELIGCGYQVSPTPTRVLRKIQRDFWRNAQIDWHREIAADAVLSFQRVVVVDPENLPGRNFFPGPGPRSYREEITAALRALEIIDPKFNTTEVSHKMRARQVRVWVNENWPSINTNGRGFDVDTIRRCHKRFCNPESQ